MSLELSFSFLLTPYTGWALPWIPLHGCRSNSTDPLVRQIAGSATA